MILALNTDLKKTIILTAGGTGGHLFPAISTARELINSGHQVIILSDERAGIYFNEPDIDLITIQSATPSGGGIMKKIRSAITILKGVLQAKNYLKKIKPNAIIGFGGYPTVPPILAAKWLKIPIIIHDQNMIIGRANIFLLKFAKSMAVVSDNVRNVPVSENHKVEITGNPLRKEVLLASERSYPMLTPENTINLLIFGGSQGAKILSEKIPPIVINLPRTLKKRIRITQQARAEDVVKVKTMYEKAGIPAEVAPFFSDLPKKIADSHLVIARSGATTVSELAVIGRPSILVPLAASLDGDQAENAKKLQHIGAAWILREKELSDYKLSALLTRLLLDRDHLIHSAKMAKSIAISDGAHRLANLALKYSK